MLITEHADISKKKVLISVINYANEDEVTAFANHLSEQTISDKILLSVVANKWSEAGQPKLEAALQSVSIDVMLFDPGENLGYLNGTMFSYNILRQRPDFHPAWISVSNTDIEFAQADFFEKLIENTYANDIGCIAPSVYVPATGAFENPRYSYRFTEASLKKRVKRFSSPLLSVAAQKLSSIKAGKVRNVERDSQYVYLAHGCCFFIIPELANALCDTPFGTLLYSEEAYVAEIGITIGKRVFYDRSLKLYHHENAVTGKLRNDQRSKMFVDSLSLIIRQFYSQTPCKDPYSSKDVCSVIVSYNDASRIENNIRLLQADGATVVVVDNGSNPETVAQLLELRQKYGITLIQNKDNWGIAAALQQGLDFAYAHHYKLLLTLDQDSSLCQGSLEEMIRVLNEDQSIASVGPVYDLKDVAATEKPPQYVDYLITSGSLTKVNQAVCIGGFDEELFIDGVDFDFSLNLRQNGYKLAIAPGAHLKHTIGEIYKVKTPLCNISISIHSPLRYYYMIRNHIVLRKRYQRNFALFFFKKDIAMIVDLFRVRLFFPKKAKYIAAIKKGREDAKNEILGKLEGFF